VLPTSSSLAVDASTSLDASGGLMFWNGAAAKITGWSLADAVARNFAGHVSSPAL
jgi:PAS domain-containing protein